MLLPYCSKLKDINGANMGTIGMNGANLGIYKANLDIWKVSSKNS